MYASKGSCFRCGCPRPSEVRECKAGEVMDSKSFWKQREGIVKAMGEREEETDNIRLGESGWKDRYYEAKMQATPQTRDEIIRGMVIEYVGEETITVGAGTFDALHFCYGERGSGAHGSNEINEHPPNEVWVTADDQFLLLMDQVSGYIMTQYELLSLEVHSHDDYSRQEIPGTLCL